MANFTVRDRMAVEALDYNILSLAMAGNAIKSGASVSIGSGSLGASDTLSVSSGTVLVGGSSVSVAGQSVGIDAADDSPRKDVVYVNSSGDAVVAKGTPEPKDPPSADWRDAFRPVPPSLSGSPGTPLVEVWVPSDTTGVDADNLQPRGISDMVALTATDLEGSPAIRANGSVGMTGNFNVGDNTVYGSCGVLNFKNDKLAFATQGNGSGGFRVYSNSIGAFIFRVKEAGDIYVPNGTLHNGGSPVLTQSDEGSGNGLNADQVDGYDVQKNGTDGAGVINFKTQ